MGERLPIYIAKGDKSNEIRLDDLVDDCPHQCTYFPSLVQVPTFTMRGMEPVESRFTLPKVTRIEARSHNLDMFMHLDGDTGYGDKFTLAMAPTLNLDGTSDTGYFTPIKKCLLIITHFLCFVKFGHVESVSTLNINSFHIYILHGAKKTLADKYEYVMHGKLYKITESDGKTPKAGDPAHISHFELDQRLFLLMRKL
ncbi:unnamed protein product [Eruca vesicaria subsp. sativa]|uniref:Uncharacterized protein n=1 Tax=Eruca vesicaria subsp. sativa TaxID=29727 RepID=A0ABC8M4Q2_ERUVS|nr:unnamed protein product [Eruca vesicaria subsp. sativa]